MSNARRHLAFPWLITWLAAGLTLCTVGNAFSTGLTSASTTNGTLSDAAAFYGDSGVSSANRYLQSVTASQSLAIGWVGAWGQVSSDTSMFQVDLAEASLGLGGQYYFELVLQNTEFVNAYDVAQLQINEYSGPCPKTGLPNAAAVRSELLSADNSDARAVFPGIDGPSTSGAVKHYCFGVTHTGAAPSYLAQDQRGTFIRRPSKEKTPDSLLFLGIVNRSG